MKNYITIIAICACFTLLVTCGKHRITVFNDSLENITKLTLEEGHGSTIFENKTLAPWETTDEYVERVRGGLNVKYSITNDSGHEAKIDISTAPVIFFMRRDLGVTYNGGGIWHYSD